MDGEMKCGEPSKHQKKPMMLSPRARALSPLSDDDFQPPQNSTHSVCRRILGESDNITTCTLACTCPFCDKNFKCKKTLKKHKLICGKNPSKQDEKITCNECGMFFSRKDNLVRHISKNRCSSQSGSRSSARHLCLFENCEAMFWHKTTLIAHLQESHQDKAKIIPVQHLEFSDWDEFIKWKDEEERQQLSYFSEQYGEKDGHSYFYCQQDGPRRILKKPSLFLAVKPSSGAEDSNLGENEDLFKSKKNKKTCNKKGRMKTGFTCIAMMKVLKTETGVLVKYYPTHNHVLIAADLKHQPLTNATNTYVNKLLALGSSPRKIFTTLTGDKFLRTNRSKRLTLTRNDFIQIKTLRERRRRMGVSKSLASDDATAVHMQVQLLQDEEYNPVLIYKPFGHEVLYGPDSAKTLNPEIFMLGLQTKEQAEMMKMCSQTILIVDATHDMDQYGCQLLNVMGVDELNRGYPLAHCISSKIEENTLKYFFEAIKVKIPDLNINCVITDDDPALINSMNSGFEELIRHILCDWHFKRTLQKELHCKVRNTELEVAMFKELCVIIDCLIESEFNLTLGSFIDKYAADKSTKLFIDYFKQQCIKKKHKWAKGFRRFPHGNVDTTMYVEAFHNILKTIYLKRKPNKRIESAVNLILQVEEDYYGRRQTTICTVAPREQYLVDISARHQKGVNISLSDVQEHDENGSKYWFVKSQSSDESYKVFRLSQVCTQQSMCFFQCNAIECHKNLCAHMYMCTCPDDFVLCKHIHRVHSAFGQHDGTILTSEEVEFHSKPTGDDMDSNMVADGQENTANVFRRLLLFFLLKEEQEIVSIIHDLSEYVKHESVKNVLYPHLKCILKEAVAQCRSVVECANDDDAVLLPQMTPTIQRASREKLKCQIRPFEKKKKSKKELRRQQSKIPKLLERIEIKKNLLERISETDCQSSGEGSSMNNCDAVNNSGLEPESHLNYLDPDAPFCVEVETTPNSQGRLSVKPKVKFVSRPIFVHGKSSFKIVDKQTPLL